MAAAVAVAARAWVAEAGARTLLQAETLMISLVAVAGVDSEGGATARETEGRLTIEDRERVVAVMGAGGLGAGA